MSNVIGPFRHTGVGAVLGPRGFRPARATRDTIRQIPARVQKRTIHLDEAAMTRAIQVGVAKGFARATAKLPKPTRDAARPSSDLVEFKARLTAAGDALRLRRGWARP